VQYCTPNGSALFALTATRLQRGTPGMMAVKPDKKHGSAKTGYANQRVCGRTK